jgi:peptidoglycan hydrolase-like protein with peptidoglycan-binding domain
MHRRWGMMAVSALLSWVLIVGAQPAADREQIRRIQERLHAVGLHPGPLDGTLSPQTVEALRTFQQQQGLPATGDLDQATRDALLRQTGGESPVDARERPGGSPVDPTMSAPRQVPQERPATPSPGR